MNAAQDPPFLYTLVCSMSQLPFLKSWSVIGVPTNISSSPRPFGSLASLTSSSDEAMSHSCCMSHTIHGLLQMGCAGTNNIELMVATLHGVRAYPSIFSL